MKNNFYNLFALICFTFQSLIAVSQEGVSTLATEQTGIQSVTVDNLGNQYFVRRHPYNDVLKRTPDGVITTYCNSGLSDPLDIVIDKNGFIYVANYTPNTGPFLSNVAIIPPGGGDAVPYVTNIYSPSALDIDTFGNIYVGEYFSQKVYKVLPGGGAVGGTNVIQLIGEMGFTGGVSSSSTRLMGVGVDYSGNVYVGVANGRIYKVTSINTFTTLINYTANRWPYSLRYNPIDGNLYFSLANQSTGIYKITPSGTSSGVAASGLVGFVDGPLNTSRFNYPGGVAIDRVGTIYVADYSNSALRKVVVCYSQYGNIMDNSSICVGGQTSLFPSSFVTWESNNPDVANINSQGVVTGNEGGSVTFSYTINNGCTGVTLPISVENPTLWYLDADNDGWYSLSMSACSSPANGWTNVIPVNGSGDCNDNNPDINPGASEVCNNGIDDDCNGQTDEGENCGVCATMVNINSPQLLLLCANQTAILVAEFNGVTNNIQWFRNGQPISGATTVSLMVNKWTIGDVYAVATCSGDAIQSNTIAVNKVNVLDESGADAHYSKVCVNQPTTFSAPFVAGGTYQWRERPDGTLVSTDREYTFSGFTGSFDVFVTSPSGCTRSTRVRVLPENEKNCEETELATRTASKTSLSSIDETVSLMFYPNPVTDKYVISLSGLSEDENFAVSWYDITGKQVKATEMIATGKGREAAQNIGNLAKGIYVVKVDNANHQFTFRVMVQ